jgi:hypothetical protein
VETDEAGIGPLRPLTATQQYTVTATLASAVAGHGCTGPGRRIGLLVDGWLPRSLRHEHRIFDVSVYVHVIG